MVTHKAFHSGIITSILLLFMTMAFPFKADVLAAESGDWPMWGYDASRRHVTPAPLPETLRLQWTRNLPLPQRAWPWQMDDFEKLAFDASYEPVVVGDMVYIASMVNDSITAYDLDTGVERWRYTTNGPVRMAPTFSEGRLYAVSDDGYLYCLDAASGALIWRFQATPTARAVLGNNRLISICPGRGGPVVVDGVVYFAAGLWPHEGVFVYALDADTAEVIWENSRSAGEIYVDSKRYYSYGGVAPQGQLVVSGDYLLVPGGRTVPGVFNRHTGEFLYLRLPGSTTGKGAGGHRVFARGDWFFNVRDNMETHIYALADGAQHSMTPVSIASERGLFGAAAGRERLIVYAPEPTPNGEEPPPPEPVGEDQFIKRGRIDTNGRAPGASDRMGSSVLSNYYDLERLSVTHIEGLERLHIMAGDVLYGSGPDGRIVAIDVADVTREPRVIWTETVSGTVFSMVAARDRLLVTTEEGQLYCFGAAQRAPATHDHTISPAPAHDDWRGRVASLLAETNVNGGYALLFGIGSGGLLDTLLAQSELQVIAYDPDPETVARFRERYIASGCYGHRVAVLQGDATTVQLPPYIASLVVSEDLAAAGYNGDAASVQALYHPLRPYGGAIALPLDNAAKNAFIAQVEAAAIEQAAVSEAGDFAVLARPGPLPGAGAWTHQYADAANSAYSTDKHARAPLSIAWFGSTPNHKTLPRHMHGPIPQVVAGKVIMLGVNHISARCVYTGRELWATELPLVGENFTSLEHEAMPAPVYFPNNPGANFIGSPYASATDSIYLIHEDQCLRLDTATGEIRDTFELPDWDTLRQQERDPVAASVYKSYGAQLQEGEQLRWGNIRYTDDWLIVAAYPHLFDDAQPGREKNWNATSSEFIVAMNRHTGAIQWVHQARYGFRHNAIAAHGDKVFVIDNLSEEIQQILRRRGIEPDTEPQVRALDIETGAVIWAYDDDVFGTSLSYSRDHDVLVQSGHPGRRAALPDEPRDRLVSLRGADGAVLWAESFDQRRSPLCMHGTRRQLIASTEEPSVDMVTGEYQTRIHPITGERVDWNWVGALRCGTQTYSEYIIAFRSGATGVADLAHDAGTTQIPGFRPGCTNSLVVADGMFNAPDYTRSCSCSYQAQTSLGLVHDPNAEWWVFNTLPDPEPGAIKRLGVNFGAPGARFEENTDLLWLEYPMVGGPAPEIPLEIATNGSLEPFRRHSSVVEDGHDSYRWVAASGIKNIDRIRLNGLYNGPGSAYTVRLHFGEPDDIGSGQRVFDIYMQGERIAENVDVAREAEGVRRGLAKTFTGIQLGDALDIELRASNGSDYPPFISGLELMLEG